MPHTRRNFVLAYVFLVILPLVALAGILKFGRGLIAPVSVDGSWNLRIDSANADSLPCGTYLGDLPLAISQSGMNLVLSSPADGHLSGAGTVAGNTLRASLTPHPEAAVCPADHQLSLIASVSGSRDSRVIEGTLSLCSTCPTLPFRAERQTSSAPKGGH